MIDQSVDCRMNWEWRKKLYDQNNLSYITFMEVDLR